MIAKLSGLIAAMAAGAPKRKKSTANRRDFLKIGMGAAAAGTVGTFSLASLAFLWPNVRGGFGATLPIMGPDELLAEIEANEGRFEFPEGRSLVVAYDPSLDDQGQYAEITNDAPVMALYQRCVHLGCTVPWCVSSQWWECPCHGSQYNRWGEYQDGPAPRGLDRFRVEIIDGVVTVDTSQIITGPSRGSGVLNQPAEGPNCQ
jgi:cytochrome b6-f complex iron-sulfur subunit